MATRSGLAAGIALAAICIGGAACNALMGLDELDMTYGAGGQGGSGGAGGAGGAGGVEPECAGPESCMPENECQLPVCVEGRCGFHTLREASSPVQVPSDCHETWCDAAGQPDPREDNRNVIDDGEECTDDLCESGTSVHSPHPNGTPCGEPSMTERCVNGVCMLTCDYSGICGDPTSGCLGCALLGDCADELAFCQADLDCVNLRRRARSTASCLCPAPEGACLHTEFPERGRQ